MKKHSLLFFLFSFFIFTNIFAQPELKGSPSDIREFLGTDRENIILEAESSDLIKPNQAAITLKIANSNPKLSVAMNENGKLRDKIISQLNQFGIENNFISISRFASSNNNSWVNSPDNYEVFNKISVVVLSESQMQDVVKLIDQYKEVSIQNIEFQNITQNEFENEVRAKAIEKVLQQKSFFEKKLGLSLKPVQFKHFSSYLLNHTKSATEIQNPSQFDEKVYKIKIIVEFQVN